MRLKKIGMIVLWGLLIAGVTLMLFAINRHKKNELCKAIKIEIENSEDNHFIDSGFVMKYISANQIIGNKIALIDAGKIESLLESNPHIKKAEVFKELDGSLAIKIWQRKVVMRIINMDDQNYYIDDENLKIPISENYTARVLVCNGNIIEKCTKCDTINSNTLKTCACIAQYVHKSSFWVSTIEQIFVTSDSAIVLTTKLGDTRILLGDAQDLEDKFNRLFTFYKKTMPVKGWDTYKSIDVSYKNQLIAKKK